MTMLDTGVNALLTRRRSKTKWLFEPNPAYGELVHITQRGTVYALLSGHKYWKPFWIGRLVDGVWCTVERELRAEYVEFEGSAKYVFEGENQ